MGLSVLLLLYVGVSLCGLVSKATYGSTWADPRMRLLLLLYAGGTLCCLMPSEAETAPILHPALYAGCRSLSSPCPRPQRLYCQPWTS